MKDFRQTESCSLLCLILSLILLLAAGCGKTGPDGAGKDAPSDGGKSAVFSGTEIALPEGWTVVPAITPLLTGSEDRPVWIAAQKGETPAEYTVFALSAKGDPDGGPEEIARFSPSDRDCSVSAGSIAEDGVLLLESRESGNGREYRLERIAFESGASVVSDPLNPLFDLWRENPSFFAVQALAEDGDGCAVLADERQVAVLDREFRPLFTLALPTDPEKGWAGILARTSDGGVGALISGVLAELRPIDKSAENWGGALTLTQGVTGVFPGPEGGLWFSDASALRSLSPDGELAEEFDFLDSGVTAQSVRVLAVIDGSTVLALRRGVPGIWRRGEAPDPSETTVLTLAHTRRLPPALAEWIVTFNETHPDARIEALDYSVYETKTDTEAGRKKLATDIVTGLVKPDILWGKPSDDAFDAAIRQGLFTDLGPFLDRDPEVNRETVFGAAQRVCSDGEGRIWGLTLSLILQSLAGPRDLLGSLAAGDGLVSERGWTLGELLDFIGSLPEDVEPMSFLTGDSAVYSLFGFPGFSAFVDRKSARCSFDSPECLRLLGYLAGLPKDTDALCRVSELARTDPTEQWRFYADGRVALISASFHNISDFVTLPARFGGRDTVLMGYAAEVPAKSGSGILVQPDDCAMITVFTSDPLAAWEFVKGIYRFGDDGLFYFGNKIAAYRPLFEKIAEEAKKSVWEASFKGSAHGWIPAEGEKVPTSEELSEPGIVVTLTDEKIREIAGLLDTAGSPVTDRLDSDMMEIVGEELSAMLAGAATPEACAARLQSRVGILLAERKR